MGRSMMLLSLAAVAAILGCVMTLYHSASVEDQLSEEQMVAEVGRQQQQQRRRKLTTMPASMRPKEHRLHPSKIMSHIGSSASSRSLWKNHYNLVHAVHTEFLQHQEGLSSLAEARLDLFKTFTLPSMKLQTSQQFIWLIWTDDHLSESLIQEMKAITEQMPNAVVLGAEKGASNLRYLFDHDFLSLSKAVVAGNANLLADYYQASDSHLLLETRLDADDALSDSFIESVQIQAALSIGRNPDAKPNKMEVFCPESHVEWRYYSPEDDEHEDGNLIHYHNINFCVNSGLTQVWNVEQPSFLDATFEGRKLQTGDNQCNYTEINNCQVTEVLQDCGETRHLGEVFFDDHKHNKKTNKHQHTTPTNTHLRDNSNNNNNDNRFLSALDPFEQGPNPVCANASNIPDPAAIMFDRIQVYPESCPENTYSCRSLNFSAMQLAIDDDVYIDGTMTELDIAVLTTEQGFLRECIPSDCSTDRVYLQMTTNTGKIGQLDSLNVELVDIEYTVPFIGTFSIEQIQIIYSNGTQADTTNKTAACANLFSAVAEDGSIAASSKIQLPQEEFEAAEEALDRDLQCGGMQVSGFHVCLAKVLYEEPCECQRRLRLLPEEEDDGKFTYKPLRASVLMSKTPTAAGMKNVMPETKGGGKNSVKLTTYKTSQDKAWQDMEDHFGVSQTAVNQLRARMDGNMEHILLDAFAGQCSPGHSCKQSAKRALGKLITKVQKRKV